MCIEEFGVEFGCWLCMVIQCFVDLEVEGFMCMCCIFVNEMEVWQIVEVFIKELVGFGFIEDLLVDLVVEDIFVNGYLDVYVLCYGIFECILVCFVDNNYLLCIVCCIFVLIGWWLDELNLMVDVCLFDGGCINVVILLLVFEGLVVLICKFWKDLFKLEDLFGLGIMSVEIGVLIEFVVCV